MTLANSVLDVENLGPHDESKCSVCGTRGTKLTGCRLQNAGTLGPGCAWMGLDLTTAVVSSSWSLDLLLPTSDWLKDTSPSPSVSFPFSLVISREFAGRHVPSFLSGRQTEQRANHLTMESGRFALTRSCSLDFRGGVSKRLGGSCSFPSTALSLHLNTPPRTPTGDRVQGAFPVRRQLVAPQQTTGHLLVFEKLFLAGSSSPRSGCIVGCSPVAQQSHSPRTNRFRSPPRPRDFSDGVNSRIATTECFNLTTSIGSR